LETKTVHIEGIGSVNITRRSGTKRISLRIKPDGSVQVSHPWFASHKEVIGFVIQHTEWIITHQKKVAEKQIFYPVNRSISTKKHTIQLLQVEQGKLKAGIKGNLVVLTIPEELDGKSEQVQGFIKKVITEVCRKEAKEHLPQRTSELATLHGFHFQKIFIKNLKSKWGSCSSTGNINLNLSLMLLPDHLIDYIILHELAHTREHNHGAGFWKLLNSITHNKAKELDREIRKNHRAI
jgi:predicted metal-dependent hydrolase